MRRRAPWALVLAVSSFAGDEARAGGPGAISWRADLAGAMAEARAQDRPVWVQFTGPWCHFCLRMGREAFVDPEVVATARDRFIPIQLQADDHEDLALRYDVSGLPATVILRPSGEVVAKHEGYLAPRAFRSFLDATLAQAQPSAPPPRPPAVAVAMGGYCPVTLVRSRRLVRGRPELTARHDGLDYRFVDASARVAFLAHPEAFAPANGGRCPVRQVDRAEALAGDPRFGALYRGRLYLCADETSRQRFTKNPAAFADADLADRGFCPHCRSQAGRLVRGRPEFSATYAGRRYLFPDAHHLNAFRASPETYVR